MPRAGYGDLEVGTETSAPQAAHPEGTAAAPGLTFATDTDVGLYRAGANQLGVSAAGAGQIAIVDGVVQPITTNDIDLGTSLLQFKDAYIDGTLEADAITVAGVALNTVIASVTPALATVATTVTSTANDSEAANLFPTFVDGQGGPQDIETDVGLTYRPSTGVLTATTFDGAVPGGRAYAFFLS